MNRPNVIYAFCQSNLVLEGYNLLHDQKTAIVLAESTEKMISGAMLSVPKWLPFASEVYRISASLKDFVLVPVNIMFSDIPNRNGVAFPYRELTRFDPGIGTLAYQSWRGKPAFVEHNNRDHSLAAGIILDSTLQRASNYQGNFYKVVLLLAWDRSRDPILANAILNKERTAYSMGAHCSSFSCSYCGNNLQKEPCEHVTLGKPEFKVVEGQLCYAECRDFLGFETSSVATPAYFQAVNPEFFTLD